MHIEVSQDSRFVPLEARCDGCHGQATTIALLRNDEIAQYAPVRHRLADVTREVRALQDQMREAGI